MPCRHPASAAPQPPLRRPRRSRPSVSPIATATSSSATATDSPSASSSGEKAASTRMPRTPSTCAPAQRCSSTRRNNVVPTRNRSGPPSVTTVAASAVRVRMPERFLVADAHQHDARDDREVHPCVGGAHEASGLVGCLDRLGADALAVVEVDPPRGRRRDERGDHRDDALERRLHRDEREARDEEAFAECDEHEQRGALGDVRTGDIPRGELHAAHTGQRIAEHRADQFERRARRPRTAAASDSGSSAPAIHSVAPADRPDQHAQEIARDGAVVTRGRPHDEARAPDLQHHERDREGPRPVAERFGDRGAHDERHEGQRHHGGAHRQLHRVEPVRHPRGRDPRPPQRADHDHALERSERRLVLVQVRGQLRQGEDEHQVEEQLDVGDAVGAGRIARTQHIAPHPEGHAPSWHPARAPRPSAGPGIPHRPSAPGLG